MEVGPASRVDELIVECPYLEDFLMTYHAALTRLTNPVLKRTIDRHATLADAAGMAGVPVEILVADVRAEIAAHPAAHGVAGGR